MVRQVLLSWHLNPWKSGAVVAREIGKVVEELLFNGFRISVTEMSVNVPYNVLPAANRTVLYVKHLRGWLPG